MRRNYPRTYRSRRPLKILLTVLLSLIIAFIILTLCLFFGLRQYIVYDPDGGLHLEIPWLQDDPGSSTAAVSPAASADNSPDTSSASSADTSPNIPPDASADSSADSSPGTSADYSTDSSPGTSADTSVG